MGATTIWERWDSMLPDGSINPGEMTSFNHYALGAVADWMHRVVGGLAPGAPGYRVIDVAPRPGGGLASAKTTHLTPYGRAEVSWRRSEQRLTVDVVVPVGTTAVVMLPDTTPTDAGPGKHRFESAHRAPADDPEWRPPFSPGDFEEASVAPHRDRLGANHRAAVPSATEVPRWCHRVDRTACPPARFPPLPARP